MVAKPAGRHAGEEVASEMRKVGSSSPLCAIVSTLYIGIGACDAIVHLQAGDEVVVHTDKEVEGSDNTFSGFLIAAD
jgi:hypothetical protein